MAIEWNGATIAIAVIGSICMMVSLAFLSNNEMAILKNDAERRVFSDHAFLIRNIGHEVFHIGTLVWCSVVHGHSRALARWWAVGLVASIWNKWVSGDQDGAMQNAVLALVSLYLGLQGRTADDKTRTWNGATIMYVLLGSIAMVVSFLFLTNNEAAFAKNDTERRLLADNAFLVRAAGHELVLLAAVAWCSVLNGYSRALARWWVVAIVPGTWNKYISGLEEGAIQNAVIGLVLLYFGLAGRKSDVKKEA